MDKEFKINSRITLSAKDWAKSICGDNKKSTEDKQEEEINGE